MTGEGGSGIEAEIVDLSPGSLLAEIEAGSDPRSVRCAWEINSHE
jgi:hypothetical protein